MRKILNLFSPDTQELENLNLKTIRPQDLQPTGSPNESSSSGHRTFGILLSCVSEE